jgi:type IV fimbrial biogenesis protein FimT
MTMRRSRQAFTLVEMMITLAILAIMLSVGVPSFRNFIGSQKVKSASYEMMTSAVIGRSEAIKRNSNVTMTPASGSDWSTGWTVASGTTSLHTQDAFTNVGMTVTTYTDGACTTAGTVASVTFASTGRPSASTCFKFSTTTTTTTRCVKLDLTGIPSTITCP